MMTAHASALDAELLWLLLKNFSTARIADIKIPMEHRTAEAAGMNCKEAPLTLNPFMEALVITVLHHIIKINTVDGARLEL
jgi:hypothetical protein